MCGVADDHIRTVIHSGVLELEFMEVLVRVSSADTTVFEVGPLAFKSTTARLMINRTELLLTEIAMVTPREAAYGVSFAELLVANVIIVALEGERNVFQVLYTRRLIDIVVTASVTSLKDQCAIYPVTWLSDLGKCCLFYFHRLIGEVLVPSVLRPVLRNPRHPSSKHDKKSVSLAASDGRNNLPLNGFIFGPVVADRWHQSFRLDATIEVLFS